jgi:hypothetical protein
LIQWKGGVARDEGTGQEEVGRLGEGTRNPCPPGVRRLIGSQSTDECRRQEEAKKEGVSWFISVHTGESVGAMDQSEEVVYLLEHASGVLGQLREREREGGRVAL